MCGIIAVLLADKAAHVNQMIVDGLTVLQHRGQGEQQRICAPTIANASSNADAAGMVTYERGQLRLRKDNGLVADVFQAQHMQQLRVGDVGCNGRRR